jgi:aconitate decarboxylase
MATQSLAEWASSLQYSDLPESVIKATVRSFYNWYGCAIAGSNHEAVAITHKALSPFFGKETSALIGLGLWADAQNASLINGISSHVHDYDDTHLETIIHPTGPVASAALAYVNCTSGMSDRSGKDLILALVVGIEAECKLGLAVWPTHYDVGWHITSTVGAIGAAVAVGKLMNLTTEKMRNAIGMAATQVTGLREMFGSHTKAFHAGRAAQNGLVAALMAEQGFMSSSTSLEGKRGWVNVVSTENRLDEVLVTLGTEWETEKNTFKPFPCGIVIHPVIDACVQLGMEIKGKGGSVDDIESVELEVHPLVLEITGKRDPKTGLDGQYSVYYGAAIGLMLGKASPAEYEDSLVQNLKIIQLRDKVDATVKKIPPESCHVLVKMKDGQEFEKEIEHAIGSIRKPMTDEQLTTKFLDQVSKVVGEESAIMTSNTLWTLEDIAQIPDSFEESGGR